MEQELYDDGIILWYLRLSLADGDGKDESNSISSQRKCIADYSKRYITNDNVVECIDDGYSGTNFERPGFQKMLLLIRNGRVRALIIKDLSRLGRNYLEVGYYLEYVFPSYNVRVIAINDHFDSDTLENGTVGMEVAIRNLMNECYSRDISKKISSAVHVKKMNGEYVFGAVPFGYQKGMVKNTIVIDPDAAKIVKYVFSLALSAMSYSSIAKRLNEEQVITPSIYLAEKGIRKNYKASEYWSYESVRNLLSNRIYTGDTETYKSHVKKVGSDRVKQIPASERIIVENTHEAIISREDFEKARNVVMVTKPKSPTGGKTSILNGYLVCSCCGGRLHKGKAENKYFLCTNARYRPDAECRQIRAEEKGIKKILFHAIQTQIILLEEEDAKFRKMFHERGNRILELQKELSRLTVAEKRKTEQKIRLYEDYVEKMIDKETYLLKKSQFTKELEELKRQETVLTANIADLSEKQEEYKSGITERKMYHVYQGHELSEEMLAALIDKVVIGIGNEIEIFWKYGDEFSKK